VSGLAVLGLTLGCAKCHDHKFDPIEQTDFFRLQACFSALLPCDDVPPVTPDVWAAYQRQQSQWETATADIRRQLDEITTGIRESSIDYITSAYDNETRQAWFTPELQRTTQQRQLVALSSRYVNSGLNRRVNRLEGDLKTRWDELQAELAKFDSLKPAPLPMAMSVCDGPGPVPETHVLDAGDYRKPEETVGPGFLNSWATRQWSGNYSACRPHSPAAGAALWPTG
jgi:hypothetical protein